MAHQSKACHLCAGKVRTWEHTRCETGTVLEERGEGRKGGREEVREKEEEEGGEEGEEEGREEGEEDREEGGREGGRRGREGREGGGREKERTKGRMRSSASRIEGGGAPGKRHHETAHTGLVGQGAAAAVRRRFHLPQSRRALGAEQRFGSLPEEHQGSRPKPSPSARGPAGCFPRKRLY